MFTSLGKPLRAATLSLTVLLGACGGGGHHDRPTPPGHPDHPGGDAGTTYDVVLLGPPGSTGMITRTSIANGGIVAGTVYATPDTPGRAFLYNGKTEVDIGTLGGNFARATAVNRCGQVTGWSSRTDGAAHAFLYDGSMHDLGTLGGRESFGLAINNCGKVTGWAVTASGQTHAFLYDGKTMQDLGSFLGQSSGEAINDVGQVVGAAYQPTGGLAHAFLYDSRTGGPMQDLHALGFRSEAVDVNNAGQVVGLWREAGDVPPVRSFYYEAGVMRDIGTLGGNYAVVNDINEAGTAVGVSDLADGLTGRGFVYDGNTMTSIGTLANQRVSYAAAINASGLVVGYSSGNGTRAISWTRQEGIVDLNTRLHAPPSGLVVTEALAVADDGNIAVQTNQGLALLKLRR
jgi:probable HAF family extracellular repeat protein